MAFGRIEHTGGAVISALNADISGVDSSLALTVATGWPTGGTGPFYLTVDPGTSAEEKMQATARSGTTLSGLTRGVDGTVAATHSAGAVVEHVFTGIEADEANRTAHATLGAVTTKGDLLVAPSSQALARLAVGSDGQALVANSAATNGVNWGTLGVAGGGTGASTLTNHGVLLGSGTGAVDVTAVGTDGQLLVGQSGADPQYKTVSGAVTLSAAGVATLGVLPCVRLTRVSNQSIASSVDTAIIFGTEEVDTDNMHDNVTNPTRITFRTPGVYVLGGAIEFDVDNSGHHALSILKNGSAGIVSGSGAAPVTTFDSIAVTSAARFATNDYVELIARQTSGSPLDAIGSGTYPSMFWAVFVSS